MLLQHIFSTVFVAASYQKNYVFVANDNLCGCPPANVGCHLPFVLKWQLLFACCNQTTGNIFICLLHLTLCYSLVTT